MPVCAIAGLTEPRMADVLRLDVETLRRSSFAQLLGLMQRCGLSTADVEDTEAARARLIERAAITSDP